MSERPEQKELLDDVLAQSAPADFRAALLGETLRLAGRRRRWRQSRRAGGVATALLLAAWVAWHRGSENISAVRPPPGSPAVKSYRLVETQPLPVSALVTTTEFNPVKTISSTGTVVQIATSDGLRFINDAQLLALVGEKPAVLIRTGPESEELVFADPADLLNNHVAN